MTFIFGDEKVSKHLLLSKTERKLEKVSEIAGTRMAGDERREQILDVAMRTFSESGFRGTTTREIAQAAGVSEAMVFRHFANKDELYTAIIDRKACNKKMLDSLASLDEKMAAKDDYQVFYTMALNVLEHHKQDRDLMRLLLYSALESHTLAKMFFERFVTDMYNLLAGYVERRQKDGVFRDFEPRIAVRALMGMITHHSLNNNLWNQEQSLLKISNQEAAHEFAVILLKGIEK